MIDRIAVLGAGTMGAGIAYLFALHGREVSLYDPNGEALQAAAKKLAQFEGGRRDVTGQAEGRGIRLQFTAELEKAVADAELIVEAAPEQLEIKRDVYRQLAGAMRSDAIVASNTSTFALQTLAENQPFAGRMVIAHFFNPAHLIPLVEIVGLPSTPPEVLSKVERLLRECGKAPVVLRRDIPGFIANRLQAAVMREACYLLENGIADALQIDTVMKEGLGLRWAFNGPFEIADLGGLDIWAKVTGHLFPQLGTGVEAPESLQALVRNGELGVKSGKGYYEYEDPAGAAERMGRCLEQLQSLKRKIGEQA